MARPAASNSVRIIGGDHRGRILRFPDAPGLRPTADRVRETLFNWLQPEIHGAHCLDLFAGSGVLGFEAASRGAGRVVMVEDARKVYAMLVRNRALLKLEERVELVNRDALKWLASCDERFDILFLDPPFNRRLLQPVVDRLATSALLAPGAHVYIEQDLHEEAPSLPGNWHMLREKVAGQVRYCLAGIEA
ncbi:MAG: 16S rRNA (guanine(966)-N(2))-methyltransferase RsmD [Gammaproteobacteria bacterium]|jgi:16S rRNA (guanine966-N2)-methyltransferase